jgi:hypothetical protein
MQNLFTKSGGAQIGWVSASWPLARISTASDRLTIKATLLGTYTFTPDQVSAVEPYVLIPFLAWGIRVRHLIPDYPQRIIFWSLGSPEAVLRGVRDSGFIPTALDSVAPERRGLPVRWSAIIVGILVWNALFMLPFGGHGHMASASSWLALVPLVAAFGLSIATPTSPTLQRLILKPGRCVGEIRPFLRLLAFVCGLLSLFFICLAASGEFNQL